MGLIRVPSSLVQRMFKLGRDKRRQSIRQIHRQVIDALWEMEPSNIIFVNDKVVLTKQIGPVNAVIGEVFVDAIKEPALSEGKLSIRWGEIKK